MNTLIFLQQKLSGKLRKKQRWVIETLIQLMDETVETVQLREFNKVQTALANEFNPYMSEYRIIPYESKDSKTYKAAFADLSDHVRMPHPIEQKDDEDEEENDANDILLTHVKTLLDKWNEVAPNFELEEAKKYARERIAVLENLIPMMECLAVIADKTKSSTRIKREKELAEVRGAMHPEVRECVDAIAEDFRKVIEANWLKHFENRLNQWKNNCVKTGTTDIDVHYPSNVEDKNTRTANRGMRAKMLSVLNVTPIKENERVVRCTYDAKTPDQLQKLAYINSVRQIEPFKYKMSFKLGGMFPKSVLKVEAEKRKDNNEVENTIMFKINNGESTFRLKNQVVLSFSYLGTPFHRYPTTFHDATVKGKKVVNPDEYRVKKALNEVYGN